MSELAFKSASQLAAELRSRELSARELLDHYLDRVEKYNPGLNAVVQLDEERARKRAAAADEAIAKGEVWGPLHGLPMTIKELHEVKGFLWARGDPQYANRVAQVNAPSVQKVIDAGANIFGITNSPINGSDVQTFNDVYGTTNNPWDLERTPGGSSGGSAAVLAAGLCGLEIGSDIGGSVRNPAHYSGVYGHKPSYRIVPRRRAAPPGEMAVVDLSVAGPMARHAEDLDMELSIIAGPEADREIAWQLDLPAPRHEELSDYRVAAWLDDEAFPVDAQVAGPLHLAVEALRGAGLDVHEAARPDIGSFEETNRVYDALLAATTATNLSDEDFAEMIARPEGDPPTAPGEWPSDLHNATLLHRTWLQLDEERQQMRAKWEEFFRRYDVLLTPVTQITAIKHDHGPRLERTIEVNGGSRPYFDQLSWAGLVTMVYLPATVAPIGLASNGMPVGIQIVGPYLEDRTTIDFAKRLSEVIGGFQAPPGYA